MYCERQLNPQHAIGIWSYYIIEIQPYHKLLILCGNKQDCYFDHTQAICFVGRAKSWLNIQTKQLCRGLWIWAAGYRNSVCLSWLVQSIRRLSWQDFLHKLYEPSDCFCAEEPAARCSGSWPYATFKRQNQRPHAWSSPNKSLHRFPSSFAALNRR